ncbi:MAG: hypothetical protein ACOY82_17015 [Pseudomonadota bacterium]
MCRVCIDRTLPAGKLSRAARAAIEEFAGNDPRRGPRGDRETRGAPARQMAVVARKRRWRPGRRLKIAFLDGDAAIRAKVVDIARLWLRHANLEFDFGDHDRAEIRISFRGPGSSSYIGTDALGVSRSKPTMTLGGLTPDTSDEEYHRAVLHEFGHVLGCIHEHQHPDNGIPWRKEPIYAFYAGSPMHWSREKTDLNFFRRYARSETNFGAFDETSIMMYGFPAEWTENGFATRRNTELSPGDIAFIGGVYPFD